MVSTAPPHEGARAASGRGAHTPISFELFPPRTETAAIALGRTIDRLAAVDPRFISVTFGAGGSSRESSLAVLQYILANTDVAAMAHLTCVGSTHAEAGRLVREFLDAGVTSFLALRGDDPADGSSGISDLGTSSELVQLIHRVQQERLPYAQEAVPGARGATRIRRSPRLDTVAVATFPTGHPRSRTSGQDIDALLAKEAAGANLAITQMFFHASDYLRFVERARAAGVTMPILPGIMPITSSQKLRRVCELSGAEPPAELSIDLEVEPDDAARFEIGVGFATRLADEVLSGGAPGLHLYTFNQHRAVLEIIERLGFPQAAATNPRQDKEHA